MKEEKWILKHSVSNFLMRLGVKQPGTVGRPVNGPQGHGGNSQACGALPTQLVLGGPSQRTATNVKTLLNHGRCTRSICTKRQNQVPYHSECFPTIRMPFLEKHEGDFYSYYLYVDLDTKKIQSHFTCPLKHFFNLNVMHSVNGHIWAHARKKALGVYKKLHSA